MPQLSSSRGAQVADRARAQADLARARARQTAADIAPLAKSAVGPSAGPPPAGSRRSGPRSPRGPQVRKSRSWAAPQLERTGVLVEEKLAPQVSDALTRAARKLDPSRPRGAGACAGSSRSAWPRRPPRWPPW